MRISRRAFVRTSAIAAAASYAVPAGAQRGSGPRTAPPSIAALKPFPGTAVPISRVDQLRPRQHDRARPGHVLQRRADDAIYGEFGIRLEDCLHITGNGPKFFTPQSPAIDAPFA